jgi:hypothetical protein
MKDDNTKYERGVNKDMENLRKKNQTNPGNKKSL